MQKMRTLANVTDKAFQQLDLSSLDAASVDELAFFVQCVEIRMTSMERQIARLQAQQSHDEGASNLER